MDSRLLLPALAASAALSLAGCGDDEKPSSYSSFTDAQTTEAPSTTDAAAPPTAAGNKPKVEVPKGNPPKKLVIEELKKGSGATAGKDDNVTVQYVGVNYSNGEQFDASWDGGQPFSFQLGQGAVIKGWDQGVPGMKEGGRRQLVIPPDLAYGAQGQPPSIGPDETLVFVIDLVSVD